MTDSRRAVNGASASSRTTDHSCPLLLNIDSVASGLLFNYYFSYLNRQIGLTNNVVLTFAFTRRIERDQFPPSIFVQLQTQIENVFLHQYPTTVDSIELTDIESATLEFTLEPHTHRISDEGRTTVNFSRIGTNDFGASVERMRIFQGGLDLLTLSQIELKDDVRQWQFVYLPSPVQQPENAQHNPRFHQQDASTKECHFVPVSQRSPVGNCNGVSTLKKTSKDCLDAYQRDEKGLQWISGGKIKEVRLVPVYYIILPSSCSFTPSDTLIPSQPDQKRVPGTIIDSDDPAKIQLARVQAENATSASPAVGAVLQSARMLRYNRYLQRTYYYFDELDEHNDIIRYLFCAEYPMILSVLDQLERSGHITAAQKYDEYVRFCNMLDRLLRYTNLSDSIRLILYNSDNTVADHQPVWLQIKNDIDRWYHTFNDPVLSIVTGIESLILDETPNQQVTLFFTRRTQQTSQTLMLIRDLKRKLEQRGYQVENANGNVDAVNPHRQTIFFWTEEDNVDENHSLIVDAVRDQIRQTGCFRNVFILVNNAILSFPCRFLKSVPYLTFDLRAHPTDFPDEKIRELLQYLENLNVLANSPIDCLQSNDGNLSQCTSIGAGCAGAFYYNYAKLLSPLADHHQRVEYAREQFLKQNSSDDQCTFISKWIFILPWIVQDTAKMFDNVISLNANEQMLLGFRFNKCQQTSKNLTVTMGGVFQRSYSPLTFYRLEKIDNKKSYSFPMEIPAALHGLQNQYNDARSHFHFGTFDPLEQAAVFREHVQRFFDTDTDRTWHECIHLVSLDRPTNCDSSTHYQQTRLLLSTLWRQLSTLTAC